MGPLLALVGLGVVIAIATSRKAAEAASGYHGGNVKNMGYTTEVWRPIVAGVAIDPVNGDLNHTQALIDFAMKWIDIESAGNPCAFGSKGAHDAQGNVLESGIGQLYSPDDIRLTGTTNAAMRAGCGSSDSQDVCRHLTAAEMGEHVRALMAKIRANRKLADEMLAATHAGPEWSPGAGGSYWSLVKLPHALPKSFHQFAAVAQRLGHAPISFDHFVSNYGPMSALEFKAISNASQTGGVVKPTANVS